MSDLAYREHVGSEIIREGLVEQWLTHPSTRQAALDIEVAQRELLRDYAEFTASDPDDPPFEFYDLRGSFHLTEQEIDLGKVAR